MMHSLLTSPPHPAFLRPPRPRRPCASLLATFLICALPGGCRWAKAPPLPTPTAEASTVPAAAAVPFRLGPGDRVQVTVFGHPESSTPVEGALLDPDGRLDLPLAGPLALGGLTLEEARAAVRADLARFLRDPQVSIGLLESASRRFYLFGEVEECGAHPLDRPLTALQALSLGGGFLPGADREQVCLLRGEKDALEVYFFNGATPGPDGLVAVQPDDLIFVRLSGAGTFRDQVFPIVQSLVPPLAALASLVLIVDKLDE